MTKFTKALALPILSAGVFGAVALGPGHGRRAKSRTARANHEFSPDTYATPAPGMSPAGTTITARSGSSASTSERRPINPPTAAM
ncbi:hypothetical protein BN970_05509 [Mycolicibacterium conceptionense]|uniref:Uncharacterized protein n=1 Tax=Mycolicibacterium conceptionense TaxID=451644 RepID=A0A0U1DW92_9MYCO|nr:hypothetical protein BN970_05509 [Mycolicibacterium conceptionense]